MKSLRQVAFPMLTILVVAGCSDSGARGQAGGPDTPIAQPPVPPSAWHGRFIGTVTIAGEERFADALLTEDGAIRIHVGEPGGGASGVIPATRHEGSIQFSGQFAQQADRVIGSGFVLGEGCVAPGNGRFCEEPESAEMNLQFDPGKPATDMHGELRIATAAGVEIWPVALDQLRNYYVLRAGLEQVQGAWTEVLAEFAGNSDTVITVDGLGQLFFQSPATGCTGNGTLAPHADGAFNVFDVSLTIASCNAQFSYLDGDYEGLATTSPTDYWAYDAALRAWLSKEGGAESPAAVTTWAPYIY